MAAFSPSVVFAIHFVTLLPLSSSLCFNSIAFHKFQLIAGGELLSRASVIHEIIPPRSILEQQPETRGW